MDEEYEKTIHKKKKLSKRLNLIKRKKEEKKDERGKSHHSKGPNWQKWVEWHHSGLAMEW